jgi:4-hydroxy-4-methyl-2-oxoglutarate aldolase
MSRAGLPGVSTISDALDRYGLHGQALGLRPIGPAFQLRGPAYTVRMAPASNPARSVGDYIDDVPPGSVIVIDNAGRLDATVWGGILTHTAAAKGVGGTVIDGVCRDTDALHEVDYPLFALAAHMRTGKDRVQMEAAQEPVSVGGVRVEPGDLVAGDRDGIVVVAAARVDEVLAAAAEIEEVEQAIRRAVGDGMPLVEARRRFGYHTLQARRDGQA